MNFMLGAITLFAGDYAPAGFAKCDGSLLSIGKNTMLFSILQTTYGGDGISNFALPKLPAVAGAIYIIAISGSYPGRSSE
jgi:microcystin-dependent protein